MSTITLTPREIRTIRPVRADASRRSSMRLTRRGRIAVVTLALLVLGALAIAFGPSVVATGESGQVPATTVVTVQPGQTLWEIAIDANPDGDVRQTVDDIMRMNSLPSAGVQQGADLAVPVYE